MSRLCARLASSLLTLIDIASAARLILPLCLACSIIFIIYNSDDNATRISTGDRFLICLENIFSLVNRAIYSRAAKEAANKS